MYIKRIENETFDEERALYASRGVEAVNCRFDGPADGESAFKESRTVRAENCFFNLRYPFWHDRNVQIESSEMTPLCRAALWYSDGIEINNSRLLGIKALRECTDVRLADCEIRSAEFGWFCKNIVMDKLTAEGEYFMMRSDRIRCTDTSLSGKYSFQYVTDCVFENCRFDTKDAFWHAKNVTVRNSVIKGEYLAWYCEDVTFENCIIIGTQPLCYCENLRLIGCEMHETDLAFEKSDVDAEITTHVVSIKNPASGTIRAPSAGEIIRDDPESACKILIG